MCERQRALRIESRKVSGFVTNADWSGSISVLPMTSRSAPGDCPAVLFPASSARSTCGAALLFVVAISAVFGRSVTGEFLTWDDNLHLTENPAFNPLDWKQVAEFWKAPYENLYIPLSYTVFALEVAMTDWLFPRGSSGAMASTVIFHGVSLSLHAVCSILVFLLLRRMALSWSGAVAGSLLFALHPLQVESVAWISETRGLLSTALGLTALWCHSRAATSRRVGLHEGLASVALILSLLAKPSAACFVGLAWLLDVMIWKRPRREAGTAFIAGATLVALVTVITWPLQQTGQVTDAGPVWFRPLIALDAVGWYLQKLCVPTGLAMDYGRTPDWLYGQGFSLQMLLPLSLIALWKARAGRTAWAGLLVFCGGLLPTLGFIPFGFQAISTVADRYASAAMLGPALLLAAAWDRWPRRVVHGGIAMGVLLSGVVSFQATLAWHNSDAVYAQALRVNPRSWIALHNQADLLAKRGEFAAARQRLEQVVQLRPQFGRAWQHLGFCRSAEGRPDDALRAFQQAVECEPEQPEFRISLGKHQAGMNQPAEAEASYRRALELAPDDPVILDEAAQWFLARGQSAAAETLLRQAGRARHRYWPAHARLGSLLLSQGDSDSAATEFEQVLALQPAQLEMRIHLAVALARTGRFQDALKHLEIIGSAPDAAATSELRAAALRERVLIHNTLGAAAAERSDWMVAVHEFQSAVQLDPQFAAGHFNLGRALAGANRFQEARQALRTALELVPPQSPQARDIAEVLATIPP